AYVVPRRPEDMDPSRVGFPRLAENNGPNPISIICSDSNFKFQGNGTEGLGYASNGKSVQETKMNCNGEELKVTHPFMSLNFDALNRSKGGSREQNRKILQKLIFHEYLHTAGWDHNDFWDPVEKCAAHCFGLGTRNDKDYCQGSGGAALITREGLERSTLLNYDIQRSNGQPADLALRSVREDFYSALLPPGMLPKEMQFQSMD
ncbi:MAG: hypothetical protein NXH75_07505, partial [Halobacteriovoraceae bacterium]|nr:hypothetical protein [Halobacteriovoraceae bacterium]